MTIQVIHSRAAGLLTPVGDRSIPNTIVTCDYFACEKALEFKGQGDTTGIIQHIINANPNGWVADRAKFYCGAHSARADKKRLKGQIRD